MPLTPRVERIRARELPMGRWRWWLWREWCFVKSLQRRLGLRLTLLVGLLGGGGLLFLTLEDRAKLTFPAAVYYTFSLIFAQPPETFPNHWLLQLMYFAVPVIGLTVILETLLEFSAIVRDRQKNERSWSAIMASSLTNHVILVGLGRVGWRTYTALYRLGIPLVVIDQDEKGQFIEEVRRNGTPVFVGDARRERLLSEANIAEARALVCATDDDLANLEVALDGRSLNPEVRVVLRMFDQNMADKIHAGFGIRASLSTAALSAPTFAAAAIVKNIVSANVLDDELLLVVRYTVKARDAWVTKSVGELLEHLQLSVMQVRPAEGEVRFFPPPDRVLREGDEIVVQGMYDKLIALALAR